MATSQVVLLSVTTQLMVLLKLVKTIVLPQDILDLVKGKVNL